jgi:hypothetical protein
MPKITEERMREILDEMFDKHKDILDENHHHCGLESGEFECMRDDLMDHPEIKSLFEKDDKDQVCQDVVNYDYRYIKKEIGVLLKTLCNRPADDVVRYMQALIKVLSRPTEPPAPVAEYEVIEYEDKWLQTSLPFHSTRCKRDNVIYVGGKFCTGMCSHFAGHEVEGESVRCAHRFNVGGEG